MTEIVKIQRRKDEKHTESLFLTIPIEYSERLKNITHMKVTVNSQGHLEYKPV